MAQRDRVECGDRPERARQRVAGGQRGVVHQHGHHPAAAAQRRLDLGADDVLLLRLEHPAPAALVGDRHPLRADHRDDHVRRAHAVLDVPVPVGARARRSRVSKKTLSAPNRAFSASAICRAADGLSDRR